MLDCCIRLHLLGGPNKLSVESISDELLFIEELFFSLHSFPCRCFSWRFPHSLCTDSFRFLKSLINNGTRDDRPVTVFHHETENRSENGEEVLEKQTGSKRREKQSGGKAGGRPASEPEAQPEEANAESTEKGENDQSQAEGEEKLMEVDVNSDVMNQTDEQKSTEDCLTAGSGEDPAKEEPAGGAASSDAAPRVSEDPPDVSDMLQFSLDSPGGACVVSLSLMSLGLLSVYMSIPKQMVVVDSNLVDNDVVKR